MAIPPVVNVVAFDPVLKLARLAFPLEEPASIWYPVGLPVPAFHVSVMFEPYDDAVRLLGAPSDEATD